MPKLRIESLVALMLLITLPAKAGQTGDMFYDSHFAVTDRPYVEGDRSRHADFFPTYQPYMRSDKDMFDHVHSDPGVTDMFHVRKQSAPDEKLYQWPADSSRQ